MKQIMPSCEDFFLYYQRNHGFKFNRYNDSYHEFGRLSRFQKWYGRTYNRKYLGFLKALSYDNDDEKFLSLPDFFQYFQDQKGFIHYENNEYFTEFQRLSKYLKWPLQKYQIMKSQFLLLLANNNCYKCDDIFDDLYNDTLYYCDGYYDVSSSYDDCSYYYEYHKRNDYKKYNKHDDYYMYDDPYKHNGYYNNDGYYHKDGYKDDVYYHNSCQDPGYYYVDDDGYYDAYYEDDYDIHEYNCLNDYFNYFKENYGFVYKTNSNSATTFNRLANFMKWSKRYSYERNKFYQKTKSTIAQKKYLLDQAAKTGWKFEWKQSLEENFEDLCKFMHWREYQDKEEEFNEFVGYLSEKRFETIEKLKEIVEWYGLGKKFGEIPQKMNDLIDFLKENLYVNIYDFVANNKKQFKNIHQLRNYTNQKDLYFPLEEAKENISYQALLRDMIR